MLIMEQAIIAVEKRLDEWRTFRFETRVREIVWLGLCLADLEFWFLELY